MRSGALSPSTTWITSARSTPASPAHTTLMSAPGRRISGSFSGARIPPRSPA